MKLELKHLAPYLPYGIRVEYYWHEDRNELVLSPNNIQFFHEKKEYTRAKPILRPLSDLNKVVLGWDTIPLDKFDNLPDGGKIRGQLERVCKHNYFDYHLPYFVVRQLLEWHFDVFDLIINEVAININTLKE